MPHDETYLIEANRRIAEGLKHVSDQEQHLAKLERDGNDTKQAEASLAALRVVLKQLIRHRHQFIMRSESSAARLGARLISSASRFRVVSSSHV